MVAEFFKTVAERGTETKKKGGRDEEEGGRLHCAWTCTFIQTLRLPAELFKTTLINLSKGLYNVNAKSKRKETQRHKEKGMSSRTDRPPIFFFFSQFNFFSTGKRPQLDASDSLAAALNRLACTASDTHNAWSHTCK